MRCTANYVTFSGREKSVRQYFSAKTISTRGGVAILAVFLAVTLAIASVDVDRMLQVISGRFGAKGTQTFHDWREMMAQTASLPEADKLTRVNDFFDRRIRFVDDATNWHQADYWATPVESLGQGAGDCEDYVIAKYFSLIELGVARSKLRWIYVIATLGRTGNTQAHMVLGYYATPGAEPLVLDNLIPSIQPASQRTDLSPVFSFNSDGIWKQGAASSSGSVNQLSMWRDLMRRMKEDGYEP